MNGLYWLPVDTNVPIVQTMQVVHTANEFSIIVMLESQKVVGPGKDEGKMLCGIVPGRRQLTEQTKLLTVTGCSWQYWHSLMNEVTCPVHIFKNAMCNKKEAAHVA